MKKKIYLLLMLAILTAYTCINIYNGQKIDFKSTTPEAYSILNVK